MRIMRVSVPELNMQLNTNKKVICFGVSKHINTFIRAYGDEWLKSVDYFVDNNSEKWGNDVEINGRLFKVLSPDSLIGKHEIVIIISVGQIESLKSIIDQLLSFNLDNTNDCYSLLRIENEEVYDNSVVDMILTEKSNRINKTIHSFWFSKEKKNNKYQECIESWNRICPEYKIIEWNADNYDVSKNKYIKKAFEMKQWAFVSDFARLDVVYEYGGIYLDMDVELLKPLDDLLVLDAFFSIDLNGLIDLGSGFGASRKNPNIKKLLKVYDDLDFLLEEEWEEWKGTIPQPTRLLPIFQSLGYRREKRSQFTSNCLFLSPDYFRVIEDSKHEYREFTGKEYAIHWHNGGWKSPEWIEKRDRDFLEKKKCFDFFDRLS